MQSQQVRRFEIKNQNVVWEGFRMTERTCFQLGKDP